MNRNILVIGLALILAACGLPSTPVSTPTAFTGTPRSVVIDTDMAADDWMAILYLLKRPEISIKAITVTGTGEAHCEPGIKNAMRLTALAGYPDIPVSCGRETPLHGSHAFPTDWRTNVDSLAGLSLPDNPAFPFAGSAVELFTSTIESSSEKVTVLTLGPLTNVAETLQAAPGIKEQIDMVYIMGGAVVVPGNVGVSGVGINNQTAEWNIYVDPHAASIVFQSGVPITLVPLDATNKAPVTMNFYERLKKDHQTPEATFVYDLLTSYSGFIRSGGYFFWDPLAAAILLDNSLGEFEVSTLVVIEEEGPESGRTQADESGGPIRVAVSADAGRFENVFINTLNLK